MCNYQTAKYPVIISDNGYQLIHDDVKWSETQIFAKFRRDSTGKILDVDFKLSNVRPRFSKFKIHFAVFCPATATRKARIELHLSFNKKYSSHDYEISKQLENELVLNENNEINVCLRITANKTYSERKVCNDGGVPSPDDKDGSILIGTV